MTTGARVLADYRETISDLLLDTFTTEWSAWARRQGRLVRNQAHGSPASLLDLYAASDIPETEGAEIQRFKWATSAAHVAGRRLVSAEAATWLGEHFRVRLADVQAAVDRFFVAGVNHIVYHGTAYSPAGDPWPGWQFYASVEFNPRNAWWDDFAALNAYVARVQSFMQSGRPDTDVLLYYPLYESLAVRGNTLLAHFGGAAPPPLGTTFEKAAETLQAAGFTYDFVSDRQRTSAAHRQRAGSDRRREVVPDDRAAVVSLRPARDRVRDPGARATRRDGGVVRRMAGRRERRLRSGRQARALKAALAAISFGRPMPTAFGKPAIGSGRVLQGSDLRLGSSRAPTCAASRWSIGPAVRARVDAMGRIYFVSNPADHALDAWVPLESRAVAMIAFDPMTGRQGRLNVRASEAGREVSLQIPSAGSLIVAESPTQAGATFDSTSAAGEPVDVAGPWTVRFRERWTTPAVTTRRRSTRVVDDVRTGCGSLFWDGRVHDHLLATGLPLGRLWQLDLGRVAESARVRLNGRDLATLIGPPYRLVLDASQLRATNTLEVSVTNLSANRVRDLDRRGVTWKKFYNVNFPARFPENRGPDGLFSAARWEPLESGLLGPVTVAPVEVVK